MERLAGIDIRQLGGILLNGLTVAFEESGWTIQRNEWTQDADLIVTKDGLRYVVGLKVAREGRKQLLESLWANAYLRTRVVAQNIGGYPLPIIGTTALSDRMVHDLEQYVGRYAPNEAFGMIDARGRLALFGHGLPQRDDATELVPPLKGIYFAARPLDLFSDLNQWMLKVLLARRLPPNLLAAPRYPVRKVSELAALANVSIPSARRLVTALTDEGFLEVRRNSYEIVNTGELLNRWRQVSSRPANEVAMRFLFSTAPADVLLERTLTRYVQRRIEIGDNQGEPIPWETGRAALGLFSAARELGLGFTRGNAAHLYLEETSAEVLEELGLTRAMPGDPVDVFIRRPSWKESTFRGVVALTGVPTTDIIQTWLDVSAHPSRGMEQADHIRERAIGPYLLNED